MSGRHSLLATSMNSLRPVEGIDERSTRLRQSSPFAGPEFITDEDRMECLMRFRDPQSVGATE